MFFEHVSFLVHTSEFLALTHPEKCFLRCWIPSGRSEFSGQSLVAKESWGPPRLVLRSDGDLQLLCVATTCHYYSATSFLLSARSQPLSFSFTAEQSAVVQLGL